MSYNKVIMMGRLTRDPKLRTIPSGTPVAEFGLATDSLYGDKKTTCFVDVTVWGKQAEFTEKYFKKGDGIHIEGRLDYETWEKDGQKRSKHKVTAERVTFPIRSAGSKNESDGQKNFKETFGSPEKVEDIPF